MTLDAKYTVDSGSVLCSGVQALVRVVFDQLRTDRARELRTAAFVSGYPGSPLGGFDRELTKQRALRDELDVHHVPGHNEELAASSVGASQLVPNFDSAKVDGVVGFWYGKAPGLDRAGDAIRHAQYIGTARTGGVVAFLGDDPACKSSTLPSGSEPMVSALQMPMLEPSTVADVIDLGLHAVALSRASGLWSVLRVVSSVADGTASFELDAPHRPAPIVPTVEWQGQPYLPRVKAEITGAVTVE
ncbi:MAG: indolepyruvate ferredoxin oxidoreductase family protein, partial [Acidimicrobiia bacterium]